MKSWHLYLIHWSSQGDRIFNFFFSWYWSVDNAVGESCRNDIINDVEWLRDSLNKKILCDCLTFFESLDVQLLIYCICKSWINFFHFSHFYIKRSACNGNYRRHYMFSYTANLMVDDIFVMVETLSIAASVRDFYSPRTPCFTYEFSQVDERLWR